MSGCSCARNVIAHIRYIAEAERIIVDLQILFPHQPAPQHRPPRRPSLRATSVARRSRSQTDVEALEREDEEDNPGELDVRLVFAFRGQKPCGSAEYRDDYEADEGRPSVRLSVMFEGPGRGRRTR
jgi:hypothetical protein